MKRPIIYSEEQGRTFDILSAFRDYMESDARILEDVLNSKITLVHGFGATPTSTASLTVNLAEGSVYMQAPVDANAYGALAADSRTIEQMGRAAAQSVTLSTSAITSGQSQWALVQTTFSQVDSVAPNDPNSGVLPFYNSGNPSSPFQGPNNSGGVLNTLRSGVADVSVIYGAAATTGSEVPPQPTTGYVPLYLIDLTYGQTAITSSDILVAGPSVGTNVPSTYPYAPFLAGLLQSHHNGNPGQAPKVQLGNALEVQGILPLANLPASNTVGTLPTLRQYAGNPNGNVAGQQYDIVYDTTDSMFWNCVTSGTASTAVWHGVITSTTASYGVDTGSANTYAVALSPALSAYNDGTPVTFKAANANTGASTLNVNSLGAIDIMYNGAAMQGGEIIAGRDYTCVYDSTSSHFELVAQGGGARPVAAATAGNQAVQLYQVQNSGVVTEGGLAGGSVHQGQLNTSTASYSGVFDALWGLSLSGGAYGWYSISTAGNSISFANAVSNAPTGTLSMVVSGASTTGYVNENYINSSPPYTEGPLFVYMGFNKAGERTHICVAPDPTWAHHGPTSLIPHFKEKGLGYRNIRMVDDVPCSVIARDVKHPLFKRYLSGDTHEVAVPIDLKYKDSDRDLEPHPWHHTPNPDTQFCLLEPGSDLMIELHQIYQDSDADNVRKIVEDYVKVGAVTDKNAPRGMVIRKASWKNKK